MTRLFALIARDRVVNVVVAPHADVFSEHEQAVDITERDPMPSQGWSYDAAGDAFAPPPLFSRDESIVKEQAIAQVNTAAGDCRAKYLTVVPGQAETYLLKADELRAYDLAVAAEASIEPADYPILASEAEATGTTLSAVADLVRATRAQWLQLAALVEGIRRGAIVRIETATSEADVRAAIPEVWP